MLEQDSQRDPARRPQAPHGDVSLSDEAIDWLVRLGSGNAGAAERSAFAAWRGRDAAHEAAAAEAEALFRAVGETERATGLRDGGAAPGTRRWRPPLSRRAVIGGALAASAAVAVAGSGALGPLARLYADYATGVGERRRVVLADGSVIYLNTASALSADLSGATRHLTLHAGEAMFDVAKDAARPFVVTAAEGTTEAAETVFTVHRSVADVQVMVRSGAVAVRARADAPVRVAAGQEVSYGAAGIGRPVAVDVEAAMAWQRGKLIFNQKPLADVVAELQRYTPNRIVVANRQLGHTRLTGVFDLDDPGQILRTIGEATKARIIRLPLVTLIT